MKNKKRALRLHHKMRIKSKRKDYLLMKDLDSISILKFINTPKPCSCFMCGNPRKFWKEKTLQEIRSRTNFEEEKHRFYEQM